MKKFLTISGIIVIGLFIVVALSSVHAVAETNGLPPQDLIEAQQRACDANEVMMQYFFKNGYVSDYPNYFAGCYIEDNMLHIRLVSGMEDTTAELKSRLTAYNDVVVYEYCETSRNDLLRYAGEIASGLIEDGYDVTSWYVSSITGDIVIEMLEEDIPSAKKAIDEQKASSLGNSAPNIVLKPGAYATPAAIAYCGEEP